MLATSSLHGHAGLFAPMVLLALLSCGRSAPERAMQDPVLSAAAESPEQAIPASALDTLPRLASVVSDTIWIGTLRPPQVGSAERAQRVNWVRDSVRVGISVSINLGPEPGQIRVVTTLRNVGDPTVGLLWGGCPFTLKAYQTSTLPGRAVWDSRRWQHSRSPPGVAAGCVDALAGPGRPFAPGDSVRPVAMRWDGHMEDVLGDSLPEGRYHFHAQLAFRGDTLHLPAGSVHLRRIPHGSAQH